MKEERKDEESSEEWKREEEEGKMEVERETYGDGNMGEGVNE